MSVSVLIATRSSARISAVLASLGRTIDESMSVETVVVVNGDASGLAASLRQSHPGIVVVDAGVNRGFAGGYNLARQYASGELLVLLHDDVEVCDRWLEELMTAADRHPDAGAIGVKVVFDDGSLRSSGMVLWSDAATSVPWDSSTAPSDGFDEPRWVDYCSSCALLVRAEAFDAIGGLNDDLFPAYYVDVDLAMAIRRLGQGILYWPHSKVVHHRGSEDRRHWRRFVATRNRLRFLDRWAADLDQFMANGGDVRSAVDQSARRRPPGRVATPVIPPKTDPPLSDAWYSAAQEELTGQYVAELESALSFQENRVAELEQRLERELRPNL